MDVALHCQINKLVAGKALTVRTLGSKQLAKLLLYFLKADTLSTSASIMTYHVRKHTQVKAIMSHLAAAAERAMADSGQLADSD